MPKRSPYSLVLPHSRVYEEELREVVAILAESGEAILKVDGEPSALDAFLSSTAPWDELEIQGTMGASVRIENSGFTRISAVHDRQREQGTPTDLATSAALRVFMVLTRNPDLGLRFLAGNYWRNFTTTLAVGIAVVVAIAAVDFEAGSVASIVLALVPIVYNIVVFAMTQRVIRVYKRKQHETVRHRYAVALKKGDPLAVLGLLGTFGVIAVTIWQILA